MNSRPIIISTDPGIDDAVAMTIALLVPQLDVQLIVPTYGNVALDKTVTNTLKLENFLQTKVPVVKGARQPLMRKAINAANIHGDSGMAGFTFPKPDNSLLTPGLAAVKIHEAVTKAQDKVSLMQIGPATDFALYLTQYPQDKEKIAELVIMGGAIGRGNWGPYGEFNIASDPEAAKIVFAAGLPVKLAPLELGQQAFIKAEELEQIASFGSRGQMVAAILTDLQDISPEGGREIYDALACGMLFNPAMYTFANAYVDVITQQGPAYGASPIDFSYYYGKKANLEVGVKIDRDRFASWFLSVLRKSE